MKKSKTIQTILASQSFCLLPLGCGAQDRGQTSREFVQHNSERICFEPQAKLIVILGPTGSGKTDLAIKLAKRFNGEIVCADSRQIYKEMFIGTASPRQNQRLKDREQDGKLKNQKPIIINNVPHHLFHIVYPNEEFNAAVYKKLAVKTIKDIQKRGKVPFLVGGTGLYIQAIVDNIKFPTILPQKKLREKLEKKTTEELFKIYQQLDPEGAKFIDKKNKRRLARAIEVCKATGKPFWRQRKKEKPLFDVLQIGLKFFDKQELEKKIKKRVEEMFKKGLEKEVKDLVKRYGFEIPAMKTIGYQEWQDYFKKKIDKERVKELIVLHTIQFAKRQMTWFRKGCALKCQCDNSDTSGTRQVRKMTGITDKDKKINWIASQREAEKLVKIFLVKD